MSGWNSLASSTEDNIFAVNEAEGQMPGLGFARICCVLALAVMAGCAPAPKPGEAIVPEGARITHRAVFIGESNYSTVGTISLYQSEQDPVIVFEPNFDLPDPPSNVTVVALGRDGYRSDTILGALLRPTGATGL